MDNLCSRCATVVRQAVNTAFRLVREKQEREERYIHEKLYPIADLLTSTSKCHLCVLFSSAVKDNLTHPDEIPPQDTIFDCRLSVHLLDGCNPQAILMLESRQWSKSRSTSGLGVRARLWARYEDEINNPCATHSQKAKNEVRLPRRPHSSTWSADTIERVRHWRKICSDSHDECNKLRSGRPYVPRRLLDVDPTQQLRSLGDDALLRLATVEEMPGVRVCDTQGFGEGVEYLTLSHRWSSSPALLLKKNNLTQFSTGIAPSLLLADTSKTIKEAIHVTRCLGFRYIWIDSACIIQDSDEDKRLEIDQMHLIYKSSALNIMATGAQTSSDGLFSTGNPLRGVPLVLRPVPLLSREVGADLEITSPAKPGYISPNELVLTLVDYHDHWFTQVVHAPLKQRGWVFQEETLAPCLLHFTGEQVFWECMGALSAAAVPDEVFFADKRERCKERVLDTSQPYDVSHWNEVISTYSTTIVTFPQDRLNALSAVARHIAQKLPKDGQRYVSGMWVAGLPCSLSWKRSSLSKTKQQDVVVPSSITQPTKYRAPTWSWASMDSAVDTFDISFGGDAIAEFVEVMDEPKFGDVFSIASAASLRIRSHLWAASISEPTEISYRTSECTLVIPNVFQRHWDCRLHIYDNGNGYYSLTNSASLNVYLDYPTNHAISGPVYLLVIQGGYTNPNVQGLLIRRTKEKGQYERVGMWQATQTGRKYQDWKRLVDLRFLPKISPDDYLEYDEKRSFYTVEIV